MITSKDCPKDIYKLMVACQVSGISNIDILDLRRKKKSFTIAHSKHASHTAEIKVELS